MLAVLALAGCGGGGGGGSPAPTPAPAPTNATATAAGVGTGNAIPTTGGFSDVLPSCTGCGAVSSNQYSGVGVATWSASNLGTAAQDVAVSIGNLALKDVTLILTNVMNADVALSPINMSVMNADPISQLAPQFAEIGAANSGPIDNAAISEFNRIGWSQMPAPIMNSRLSRSMIVPAPMMSIIGDARAFNYADGVPRQTTLKKQITLSDGATVNVWVEDTEFAAGKITPTLVTQLGDSYGKTGGVYDMLKDAGGAMWGAHTRPDLIDGTINVFDVVLLNFVKDSSPYGMVGYFYALNNMKKTTAATSNESLSIYLDTETLYLGGTRGFKAVQSVLAHESMHMSNFYRRSVLMGPAYAYSTWLEEMTAMIMEDAASFALDATYNAARDERVPSYLSSGSFNCALQDFGGVSAECNGAGYSVSGSFGAYLLRQNGMPFFKNLLTQNVTSSEAALQAAIKSTKPTSSIGAEMAKFATSTISLMSSAAAPSGFNFPQLISSSFDIPLIDIKGRGMTRKLPTTAPTVLKAYGNFPLVRKSIVGVFNETVRLPAGTTLSVVIGN